MRRLVPALMVLLLALAACAGPRHGAAPAGHVLFVGNSLLYSGNTPAVYAALASAHGMPIRSDMLVRGGATLHEHLQAGHVAEALAGRRYGLLVLQERGGDLLGSFGPEARGQSRQALAALAQLGRAQGVPVLLLGSYQPSSASASRAVVEAEQAAAAAVGIGFVEISESLRRMREAAPGLRWFVSATDVHPASDLALLNAVKLFHAHAGRFPASQALDVGAPIYDGSSGLDGSLHAADAPAPREGTPQGMHYPAQTVSVIVEAVRAGAVGVSAP